MPINKMISRPAYDTLSASGIRPLTTYMPDEYIRIHILFTFHAETIKYPETEKEGVIPKPEKTIEEEKQPEQLPAPQQPPEYGVTYKEQPTLPPPEGGEEKEEITEGESPSISGGGAPPPPQGIKLRVTAIAPGGTANISLSPPDLFGQGNGITPFIRTYTNGTTIDITAATNAAGWNFVEWLINGSPFPGNNSPYQQFTLIGNITLTAVYAAPPIPGPWTLSARASAPGGAVPISLVPTDLFGNGSGTTPFLRTYSNNTAITIMAPPAASGWQFVYWERNGSPFTGNSNLTQNLIMTNHTTMMAIYRYIPPIIIDPPVSAGGL